MSRSRKRQQRQERENPKVHVEASRSEAWLAGLVILGGLLAYSNGFAGVFLLDDNAHIVENTRIRSLADLGEILTTRRPVVTLSLAVNYALGGLNPWGYHLFNLLVHLLAGVTLFAVVRRTLLTTHLRQTYGAASAWIAAIVALLWGVHPLQTESVTYVIQRGESLMGLFYLLMLYCIIRGVCAEPRVEGEASRRKKKERAEEKRSRAGLWYAAAIICCALGMGSKAVMITAPVVALLYDRIFLASSFSEMIRRRGWLYVGLAATWGLLVLTGVARGVLQSEGVATVGFGVRDATPGDYALTQPEVVRHYLKLCLWPYPLCLDYGWPVVRSVSQAAGSLIGVLVLIVATVWGLVRKPALGFVGLWFFAILLPTSSFIPIRDLAFEHRMYLSLAAVVLLVVLGVYHALLIVQCRYGVSRVACWGVAAVLTLAVCGGLIFATHKRNVDYHDGIAMWGSIIAVRPENARAYSNRASLLFKSNRFDEVEADCRKAIALDPQMFDAWNSLGLVLKNRGRFAEAIDCFEKSLEHASRRHRARILSNMVMPLLQVGRVSDAIRNGQQAVALNDTDAESHNNYGMALWMNQEIDMAEAEYRAVLLLDPNLWQAHHNLGMVHNYRREYDKAIEEFEITLRLRPDYADAHFELANALIGLSQNGRPELRARAIREIQTTLRYNPNHSRAKAALSLLGVNADANDATR